jgi:formiminotetrahydrofolate cyclodeaminase
VTRFREMSLGGFGEALASYSATPGGGCASALSGGLAAALVAMVARTTIGDTFPDRSAEMGEIAAEADRLRDELLALVDEDAAAFDRVMEAFRLPKGTPQEQGARSAAVQKAYRGATDPPLRVCVLSVRVLELGAAVAERGNPNAVSDAGVAALLAATALEGGALNVRINLGSIKDEELRTTREREVDVAQTRGRELLEQAQAAVRVALS